MIVAVDGPAGSGKGTITKAISKKLGLINLDTGATYRCVALAMIKNGIELANEDAIIKLLDNIDINFEITPDKDIIYLNGEDVTTAIREKDVTATVSPVSSIIPVRLKMVELQRKMAEGKDVIMEGRDIGTYVFPNADVKIFLDGTEEERAKRRYLENKEKGIECTLEEVRENIRLRDENDKNKKIGALKKADDAIFIDTTPLTIEQVVQRVEEIIKNAKK